MEVIFIKLTNGDELFAKCVSQEGDVLYLDDPMIMETISTTDEAVKYLFMGRYSQYGKVHSISIERSKIVFIGDVTETIQSHYEMSVKYASEISDEKFQEGIAEATKYLSSVLKKNKKTVESETFESVKDRIFGTFLTDTNTKH